MNILGVILARKGSKGIKNKNHLKLNGRSLIIIFGIKRAVNVIGKRIELLTFLKNSISSNKFKISPKQ